ncbi:membrane hypothetical protein [uncultured spirochete]|jgi:hypothetical protein|uniref:Uncharacterized protein n=1 Tax=uncultured spirochete TaxID=156406 RepID=A0A3P3XMD8_9SPIR|nr:membrane hypothetical protein [uncultured spirochete]
MDEKDALKDIADIKALMRGMTTHVNRNAGWFFIVWGIIWIIGFMTTQVIGNDARFVWLALNILGIGLSFYLLRRFFGKRGGQMIPGLGRRIFLIFAGTAIFGILVGVLFGISSAEDITLLVVLLSGLCYFMAGIVGPAKNLYLGLLLWAASLVGRLAFPSYLPLIVAIVGGATFLGLGISFLLRREL